MEQIRAKWFNIISKNTALQAIIYFAIVIIMSNLNAVVDHFLHPDIPYFDEEHLIVGGTTGFACLLLFGALMVYMRHLHNAINRIKNLEDIVSICSYCKRMKNDEGVYEKIESYFHKYSGVNFSHTICPECYKKEIVKIENLHKTT